MLWAVACLAVISATLASLRNAAARTTSSPARSGLAQAKPPSISDEARADLYMIRKSYDNAADFYYRALEQQGFKNARLWNKLGIAREDQCQQKGCFVAARKAYISAIHLDKQYAAAWNNLGTTYYLDRKIKKSIKYYARAIRLKPGIATYHLNLGTAEYTIKKYPVAFNEFRRALTLDPNIFLDRATVGNVVEPVTASAQYYFYLAKVFASLGRAQQAVLYLRHAMEDGFRNKRKIRNDPDLKKISHDPAFVQLLKNPPLPLTR